MDDILVNSTGVESLISDLEETFTTIRKYNLKYTFGVKSGSFLGYMLTKKGMKVNPEKIQALQQM